MTQILDSGCGPAFPQAVDGDVPSGRWVTLLGFDFGSTTSSAVVARAGISAHRCSGRVALERPRIVFQPPPVFTPFAGDGLDISGLRRIIEGWMDAGGLRGSAIFSGGAIITGLAAARKNAGALARIVREYAGNALIATADDPALESWLAFMGGCESLSRRHPETPVLNFDIGGGTTNTAVGLNGDVLSTGCAFIGARHFCFAPGSYRLTRVSSFGERLLQALEIPWKIGEIFAPETRDQLLQWQVDYLEETARGCRTLASDRRFRFLEQVPMALPGSVADPRLTFSGGVGALVYAAAAGEPLPGTTAFGDLGIDLACRIAASPLLSKDLADFAPRNRGRATVTGLAMHHTEISGTTLFLPQPERLPLRDLPIVARFGIDTGRKRIEEGLVLAQKCAGGAAVQVTCAACRHARGDAAARLRRFSEHLSAVMSAAAWHPHRPLVLLVDDNCGRAMGSYATCWGARPLPLIVLDEIPDRGAQFVTIGREEGGLVPVSFFGMQRDGRHPAPARHCPERQMQIQSAPYRHDTERTYP